MADTLSNKANLLADILREHKGQDVVLIDLNQISNWTDYFLIATAQSRTHMDGMEKYLKEYCRANDIEILGSSRKNKSAAGGLDDEWRLIDLGWIVIHLMTAESREFYDLERLWKFTINN